MESADEEAAQRLCGWPKAITVGKRTIVPTLNKQEKNAVYGIYHALVQVIRAEDHTAYFLRIDLSSFYVLLDKVSSHTQERYPYACVAAFPLSISTRSMTLYNLGLL